MSKRTKSFLTGALILTITSLFVRLIGFAYRIWLSNAIGSEGMGVYSLIMSVYGLCITLSTSSISLAVSRLVAEQLSLGSPANAKRVLKYSVLLSTVLGSVVCFALLAFANPIAIHFLKDERTLLSLRFLAPGLPFIALSSCFRGYFIAQRKTGNAASGQVIEQLFKIGFIVFFIDKWIPYGVEYSCALIVLGLTLGEIICFVYTFLGYLFEKHHDKSKQKPTAKGVMRQILEIIIPVSAASYIRSGLRLFENVLTLDALKKHQPNLDTGTSTYGMLKGMAMPLLTFPLGLMSSFVITLTPEISRLHVSGRKKMLETSISKVLQYTCLASTMIVCIFMSFSRELGLTVYSSTEVGEMLYVLSFLSPFMCLEMVTVSILQGLGEQISSTAYSVADCFLRIVLVMALIPKYGVAGFMVMTVASNLFTSVLNLYKLLKITKVSFKVREWLFKPAIAAAASGQIIKLLYRYNFFSSFGEKASLIIGITIACIAYLALLFMLDCINKHDIESIMNKFKNKQATPEKKHIGVYE